MEKLNKYASNVTSQHGEDGIITYILERGKGIEKNYGHKDIKVFEHWLEIKEENSLDSLFKKHDLPAEIGVLSIDIDSFDYHLWKHVEYINPVIVIIEHNQTIPGYVEYHDPEDQVFLRASAKALETLGKEKGYKLICCTHTNSIFIRNDYFNNKYFPDMPVECLFDYSGCYNPILSAYPNLSPAFYNKPSWKIRYAVKFYNYLRAKLSKFYYYKKPSPEIIEHCKQFGIYFK